MFLAGREVRIVKNCDRGLENAAQEQKYLLYAEHFEVRGHSFFPIRTDPKPGNNMLLLFLAVNRLII